jgi:hypothetical protein
MEGDGMDPVFEEPVKTWPTDTLVLGNSSWHGGADRSLKYAWPDKNGKRARGGELPISAVPQAVMFAARTGFLTREETAMLVKGLVDILAASPVEA